MSTDAYKLNDLDDKLKKYELHDDDIKLNADVLFDDDANDRDRQKIKQGLMLNQYIKELWKELSKNEGTLIDHIYLGKVIAHGINELGDKFYVSLEKKTIPQAKIKYYVDLILKNEYQKGFQELISKKKFRQIEKEHIDERVESLKDESIKNMKSPSPYKLRNMKSLEDKEFYSVVAGDDTHYEKVDKKKLSSDELKREKIEFSKKHGIDIRMIDLHLKQLRGNPLRYVEQVLENEALMKKLETLNGGLARMKSALRSFNSSLWKLPSLFQRISASIPRTARFILASRQVV